MIKLSGRLPGIAFGIKSFAVHVPENADWFFTLGFTLKNIWLTATGCLVFEFDFELWWCWIGQKKN